MKAHPGGANSPLAAPFSVRRGDYEITTDRSRMDLDVIHGVLTKSYWAEGIPRETVERSLAGALCFALLERGALIGFARVITDAATFAYLSDVFVIPEARGDGLGKWLIDVVLTHPALAGLRRFVLVTRDAQMLYGRFGFKPLAHPERFMEIVRPDVYRQTSFQDRE